MGNSTFASARNVGSSAATLNTRATSLCPDTSQGRESNGYNIYCSHAVDPSDASDTIVPADTDVETFEACLSLCDDTDGCTGLSYIEASTTCYLHKGAHRAAYERDGWDGAIKVGTETTTKGSNSAASKSSSASASSATASSSTGTPSGDSSGDATASPITQGAIAGIAIGAASFGVISILLITFFIRKRRAKKTWTIRYPIEPSNKGLRSHHVFGKPASTQSRLSKLRSYLLAQKRGDNDFKDIDDSVKQKTVGSGSPPAMDTTRSAADLTTMKMLPPRPITPPQELESHSVSSVSEIDSWSARHEMDGKSSHPSELDSRPISPESYPSYSSAGSKKLPAPVSVPDTIDEMQPPSLGVGDARPYSFVPEQEYEHVRPNPRTMREI
ncbi:hypothetical protein PMZ80_003173 [Knufia obscura]|uniref:Apple domain-containing protein n=2 Tax=Knufia TaxID=430999 RepID=A0AAN8E8W7_9EURO|nr:hypothetical protein PMZ80_003173 [Knufia obscura]KAK5949289.1 hypothetical protein OHC33_009642 [Knufia fluminis]